MLDNLLNWMLPFVAAPITVVVSRFVLNFRKEVDNLPAWLKQLVVAGVASGLVILAKVSNVDSLCGGAEVCTIDNLDVKAAVTALLAFVLHNGLKKK